jgi:hypothetical protein
MDDRTGEKVTLPGLGTYRMIVQNCRVLFLTLDPVPAAVWAVPFDDEGRVTGILKLPSAPPLPVLYAAIGYLRAHPQTYLLSRQQRLLKSIRATEHVLTDLRQAEWEERKRLASLQARLAKVEKRLRDAEVEVPELDAG